MTEMLGADVRALERLARAMHESAGQLDRIRAGIRAQLYSIHWDGADGQHVRSDWDRRLAPFLAAAARDLLDSERALQAQIVQQLEASGERAGSGSRWDTLLKSFAPAGALTALTAMLQKYGPAALESLKLADFIKDIPATLKAALVLAKTEAIRSSLGLGGTSASSWMKAYGSDVPVIGIGITVMDIAYNWSQKGLYDEGTVEAIGIGGLGVAFGFVAPPLGSLAFTAGTTIGKAITDNTQIDEKMADAGFSVAYGDRDLDVPAKSAEWYRTASLEEKEAYAARLSAASAEAARIAERSQKPWLYATDYFTGAMRGWF